jgi:acetoin utilization protein AcuC
VSGSVALVTVDDIARMYDFGAEHPLRPERVLLTYDNISDLGMLSAEHVTEIAARVATEVEIRQAHAYDFVDAVKSLDWGMMPPSQALHYGLGTPDNPIFMNMHDASCAVAGATLTAADAVASGEFEHSFNPAGGLHHARKAEASGFCIYNDPAIAIAKVLVDHPDWRVMYLDVDVHHGDGVQWIFYDEPRVLTLSIHQSGRTLYPGTGFEHETGSGDAVGTAANIPLAPRTGTADYLWALESTLPALAEAFKPDLILTQLGADTHHGDPLADLGLTMDAFPVMARIIHDTAHKHCSGRWVATGGGGYQFDTIVPKVWTIYFAEMIGRQDLVPAEWLVDLDEIQVSRPGRAAIEASVESVLDACLPRLTKLSRAT